MKPEITDHWLTVIKNSQSDLVDLCRPLKRVADLTGRSTSEVDRWTGGVDFKLMNIAQIMVLQAASRRPLLTDIIIEFMAAHQSGVEPNAPTGSQLSEHVAGMMDHAARILSEAVRAQADGHITPAEAQRLRKLSATAGKFIAELEAMLAGIEVAGGISLVSSGGR
jgi:hypothetical protein